MSRNHELASRQMKRSVNTYARLIDGSFILLDMAANETGLDYLIMASLLFSAFAYEAILNHIGSKTCSCWNLIEKKMRHKDKLKSLAIKLDLNINPGTRPYQTAGKLMSFRDTMAHGKSMEININDSVPIPKDPLDDWRSSQPKTDWEKCCTFEFAKRAHDDVTEIIEYLFSNALPDEIPFDVGNVQYLIQYTERIKTLYIDSVGNTVLGPPSDEEGGEA